MAHNDYFGATYPDRWQILGVTLKPFSLGHYFKLRRLGCAFVDDNPREVTLPDLILGVLVCSMPSDPDPDKDEFWTWLNRESAGLWWRVKGWLIHLVGKRQMTPAEWEVFKWGQKIGTADLSQKAKLFSEYIAYYSETPAYFDLPGPKDSSGAHWSHGLLSVLTSKCGYSEQAAFNVSLRRALADYYKHIEAEGGIRLMTPEEVAVAT